MCHQSFDEMDVIDVSTLPATIINSYGNYRPRLLRLLQCQDLELSLPHAYTSAWQLQLNNPQLNSTL